MTAEKYDNPVTAGHVTVAYKGTAYSRLPRPPSTTTQLSVLLHFVGPNLLFYQTSTHSPSPRFRGCGLQTSAHPGTPRPAAVTRNAFVGQRVHGEEFLLRLCSLHSSFGNN